MMDCSSSTTDICNMNEMILVPKNSSIPLEQIVHEISLPKHKLVMLRTDIGITNTDKNFMLAVQTLKKIGHDVLVVTSNFDWENNSNDLFYYDIQEIGSWIPRSFFKYFTYPFYLLRTTYLAFWIILHKRSLQPSLVLSNGSNVAIPILNVIGKLRVIHFQYFPELVSGSPNSAGEYITARNPFYHLFLNYADEIIVPNKLSREIFMNSFPKITRATNVLYPCIETRIFSECPLLKIEHFVPDVQPEALVFLAMGPFQEKSNFELAIVSFFCLLHQIRQDKESEVSFKLLLIIAGHFDNKSKQNQMYWSKISEIVKKSVDGHRVVLLPKLPLFYKKALLEKCVAYLHTPINDLYDRTILEAMYMHRHIVATNTGIATELIKHRFNGYLSSPDPQNFSHFMKEIIKDKAAVTYMNYMAHTHFKKHYGISCFSTELQNLVVRNTYHMLDDTQSVISNYVPTDALSL